MRYRNYKSLLNITILLACGGTLISQPWINTEVKNFENPVLTWNYQGDTSTIKSVELYRAPLEKGEFAPINTAITYRSYDDTLRIEGIDTTLVDKALYRYYVRINNKPSGYLNSPVAFGHNLGYIPRVSFYNFDYTSATDSKSILLSWSMTPDPTIKAIYLYRSENADEGFERIATISPQENSYRDFVQKSNEAYFYFFEAIDYFEKKHVSIVFHGLCHYEVRPYPPLNFTVVSLDNKAKLTWQKSSLDAIGYNVYRKDESNSKYYLHYAVLDTASNITYIDSFPSEGQTLYKVESISDGYLTSASTEVLSYYKPKEIFDIVPSYGSVVVDSMGNIQLIWESLENQDDVMAYKLIKVSGNNTEVDLAILDTDHNYYTDTEAQIYQDQRYRVYCLGMSSVSSNHLDIIYSSPSQQPQVTTQVQQLENGLLLSWTAISNQYKSIKIYRSINQESFKLITTLGAQVVEYRDAGVEAGSVNYQLSAVDHTGSEVLIANGINF